MKEITIQDIRSVREKARKSATATLVTGDIVESEAVEQSEKKEPKSEEKE